jgi:hypothetical protein
MAINYPHWDKASLTDSRALMYECLAMLVDLNQDFRLNATTKYIGLYAGDMPWARVRFRPREDYLVISVRVDNVSSWTGRFASHGIPVMRIYKEHFQIQLTHQTKAANTRLLHDLFQAVYQRSPVQ